MSNTFLYTGICFIKILHHDMAEILPKDGA